MQKPAQVPAGKRQKARQAHSSRSEVQIPVAKRARIESKMLDNTNESTNDDADNSLAAPQQLPAGTQDAGIFRKYFGSPLPNFLNKVISSMTGSAETKGEEAQVCKAPVAISVPQISFASAATVASTTQSARQTGSGSHQKKCVPVTKHFSADADFFEQPYSSRSSGKNSKKQLPVRRIFPVGHLSLEKQPSREVVDFDIYDDADLPFLD